ncbi:MAG: polyprenyl synthetase family protein [Bacillota bacterium]|nr:polyprenyl synthetase family protein [Bacillota bacterium]
MTVRDAGCPIEGAIARTLEAHPPVAARLEEMMRYSLEGGGKRVRPRLVLMVAQMLGADPEELEVAAQFAAAIEILHSYSLVHDDLPCMDDDQYRRGRLSCHARFGYAEAVLTGDALLNLAMETLISACRLAPPRLQGPALEAAALMARAGGAGGMVSGQILDIHGHTDIRLEDLKQLQRLKTGALIRAACLAPALLLEAPAPVCAALEDYAAALGLGFQIRDDILDATGDQAVLGKTTGKDARDQKASFVTVLGLENAKLELEAEVRLAQAACGRLAGCGLDPTELGHYVHELAARNH